MTFLGSSGSAGNVFRCPSSILHASSSSLALRPYIVNRIPIMTATPPPRTNHVWHPARGISFSPSPAPRAPPALTSRTRAELPTGGSQDNVASLETIGALNKEALATAVAQQMVPPNLTPNTPAQVPEPVSVESTLEASVEASVKTSVVVKKRTGKVTNHPPPPVLDYKMVDDLFYAAKKSPQGSPESFWSYTQYRYTGEDTGEDGSPERVKVHYCRSKHTMQRVCYQYFAHEKVLGFDLEWVADAKRGSGPKKNVSLIQLASPSRIGLFHLALFSSAKDMVGPAFRSIMENPDITKVGVAIKGDATRLRHHLDIHSEGLMELSNLYKLVRYSRNGQRHMINRKLVTLATQVEEYLHLPLFKGSDVRSSNWAKPLNMDQVKYSGSDAYAGVHLYATLNYHREQLDPCPPLPLHAERNLPLSSAAVTKRVVTTSVTNQEPDQASPVSPEKKPAPKADRPKDSRVEIADDRAASYRASQPKEARSPVAQLRSYYLWHCYDLSPDAIAKLVRDPPVRTITIATYILTIVQANKLPADRDRLREVADLVPEKTLWARWPDIALMVTSCSGPRTRRPNKAYKTKNEPRKAVYLE